MHNNRRSFEGQALPFATGLSQILEKHPTLEKTICGTIKWVKQLGTLCFRKTRGVRAQIPRCIKSAIIRRLDEKLRCHRLTRYIVSAIILTI